MIRMSMNQNFFFFLLQFLDDDRKCYLEMNYTFDIRRDWPSS